MTTKKPAKKKAIFLVCVNDKDHSHTALKFACAKAKATGAEVALISVVDPLDYNTIFSVADVIKEERLAETRKLLSDLAKEAEAAYSITPKKWAREGLIADAICAEIEANSAISLLVLGVAADGSSNKGGLLTSLVEMIGHRYHVPLLVVPGNLTDRQITTLN